MGDGRMGSNTETVLQKGIMLDKFAKAETSCEGEWIKDNTTGVYSEYNRKVMKCLYRRRYKKWDIS
jgi:hypothetical protein